MTTYVGFSTQSLGNERSVIPNTTVSTGSMDVSLLQHTSFRVTDTNLIIQDLLNSLNIPRGQIPGKPEFGTDLWNYIFEPNTLDLQEKIKDELIRLAKYDPRLILGPITIVAQEHEILIDMEIAIAPMNNTTKLSLVLDSASSTAKLT